MCIYWTWKKLPEFQQHTKKEYRQVIRQVGLRPFRHWQVWAALLVASLLMLLGLETMMGYEADKGLHIALYLLGLAAVILLARLLYRQAYLHFLRPYIGWASFAPAGSWWRGFLKSSAIAFVPFALFIVSMFGIDWTINLYDENLDPSVTELMAWPEPVPENENGYFAMVGMEAPVGTAPFEAGRAWVAATNAAAGKNAEEYPNTPSGLMYVAYVAKPKPQEENTKSGEPDPRARFCEAGKQACWRVVREERSEITAWLAANGELLNRYISLQKYPRWQYPVLSGTEAPIPNYRVLLDGQSLLLATAMLSIDKGQVEHGLNMIGDDIRFVRRTLEGKDGVVGKVLSLSLLQRDLAVLSETLHEKSHDLKPYLAQVEKMVSPLSAKQVSFADAYWLEKKQIAFSYLYHDQLSDHHIKKNTIVNLQIEDAERRVKRFEVSNVSMTTPINDDDTGLSLGVMGWYHNQKGRVLLSIAGPGWGDHQNRLFDLNVMNTLVRLQLMLVEKGVSANDVPSFLSASDRSLWNPETGKPFEWDAGRKQIYFVPATDSFKKNVTSGGLPGRVGLSFWENRGK